MRAEPKYETISVSVEALTLRAVLVTDGICAVWIPKSLIEEGCLDGVVVNDIVDLAVEQWFLEKEGLL